MILLNNLHNAMMFIADELNLSRKHFKDILLLGLGLFFFEVSILAYLFAYKYEIFKNLNFFVISQTIIFYFIWFYFAYFIKKYY